MHLPGMKAFRCSSLAADTESIGTEDFLFLVSLQKYGACLSLFISQLNSAGSSQARPPSQRPVPQRDTGHHFRLHFPRIQQVISPHHLRNFKLIRRQCIQRHHIRLGRRTWSFLRNSHCYKLHSWQENASLFQAVQTISSGWVDCQFGMASE